MAASAIASMWRFGPLPDPDGDADRLFGNALVRALERLGGPEAVVALRALAAVGADSYATQARAAAERLSTGSASQPPWVDDLGRVRPVAALVMRDEVFDDGVSVLIEFARPNAESHTLGLYIEHNMGGIVKDAFVAGPLGEMRERFPDLRELELAEARARVERALDVLDHTLDPPVDKDVNRLRGFMYARAKLLPDGAVLHDEFDESAPEDRESLLVDFLFSPEGERWRGDADAEDVAVMAIAFGVDYSYGGPLRWSPAVVEIFMTGWLARKVPCELDQLFAVYEHDPAPAFAYTKALAAYSRDPGSPKARRLLAIARELNPHVPAYLTGRKLPPKHPGPVICFGEESEAIDYAAGTRELWANTAGALAWLEFLTAPFATGRSEQHPARWPAWAIKPASPLPAAWSDVMRLCELTGIDSIREFDDRFSIHQSLFNWSQDLEDALWNAGRDDPMLLRARVAVCEEALRRFPDEDELMVENRRRAVAESYFELGETDRAEALFEQWLAADPRWGWGWIGWADLHFFTNNRPKDHSRAGELLRRGYSTPGVRSREDIADRLVLLYRETGRDEEAEALAAEAKRISRSNSGVSVRRTIRLEDAGDRAVVRDTATATFEGDGFPLDRMMEIVEALDAARPSIRPRRATKVARNAPCPCGSGRKYKKCCGSGFD